MQTITTIFCHNCSMCTALEPPTLEGHGPAEANPEGTMKMLRGLEEGMETG